MRSLGAGALPLKTGRGLNDRLHWAAKAARAKRERKLVGLAAMEALSPREWTAAKLAGLRGRFVVLMCRVSPSWKPIDDDNLRGSLKATRDALAHRLGVDDGDFARLRFEYSQRRGPWAVEFHVGLEDLPISRAPSCRRCFGDASSGHAPGCLGGAGVAP